MKSWSQSFGGPSELRPEYHSLASREVRRDRGLALLNEDEFFVGASYCATALLSPIVSTEVSIQPAGRIGYKPVQKRQEQGRCKQLLGPSFAFTSRASCLTCPQHRAKPQDATGFAPRETGPSHR